MEIIHIDQRTICVTFIGAYSGKKFNLVFTIYDNNKIDRNCDDCIIEQRKNGSYQNIEGIKLLYSTAGYVTYLDLTKIYKFSKDNKTGRIKSNILEELERLL